tara:strand:+ start:144 stop:563 length:420 start_codon:yes stop_codon:yes gene_type:complete
MSAMKFQIGEPKKLTLAFDEPKTGTNSYGMWYMYGFKNGDLSSEEDCFFATPSLHTMIKTLGAGEGDEITIEKCQDGEITFFKVNGLTLNEMNSGGSAEKIAEASPKSEVDKLKARIKELESELSSYRDSRVTDADIPF